MTLLYDKEKKNNNSYFISAIICTSFLGIMKNDGFPKFSNIFYQKDLDWLLY